MFSVKKLFSLFLLFILLVPSLSSAADFSVRPFLIDRTGEPRDEFDEVVKLRNESQTRKYVVYATVNEIAVDTEGEIKDFVPPVMSDRSQSVTSWLEVTRGRIEIPPGESREVPVRLNISPYAEPGEYHAFLGFVPAPNRPAAEATAMQGEADGVVVKVTIADQRSDRMKVSGFLIDRFVTDAEKETINIEIENLGDITSAPMGEIIFYNSRGEELSSVAVNQEANEILPGESVTLSAPMPSVDTYGRTKANLSLRYGENQRAALQDTAFFYLVPLPVMISIIVGILCVSLGMTFLFKRAFIDDGLDDDTDEVTMYVRDGHDPDPKDHDINLKDSQ